MTAILRVEGAVAGARRPKDVGTLIGAVGAAVFAGLAVLVLLLAFYRAAFAQHHNHPPQDAALHERFYSIWMRPDNPSVNCCNKQDCYPAEFKLVGGTWFAKRRDDGEWVPIPEERFEHNRTDRTPADSPDGRSHVCMHAADLRIAPTPYGVPYSGSVGDAA